MKKALLAILITLTACTFLHAQGEGQKALLNRAYGHYSDSLLCQFFENWAEELPSNEAAVTNDTIKAAYEVFEAFFYAMLAEELADSNAASRYQDQPFFAVQGTLTTLRVAQTIPYTPQELESFFVEQVHQNKPKDQWEQELARLHDDEWYFPRYDGIGAHPRYLIVPTTLVDSTLDFRPFVCFGDKQVLYLTKGYRDMLGEFVGERTTIDYREEAILEYSRKSNTPTKRAYFLSAMLPVEGYYSGRYWRFTTGPSINYIVLDSNLQRAVVSYALKHAFLQTIMEKHDGEWVILTHQCLGIE